MKSSLKVSLNWRLMPPELDFILSDATPQVLIYDTANAETVTGLTATIPHRLETTGGGGDTTAPTPTPVCR